LSSIYKTFFKYFPKLSKDYFYLLLVVDDKIRCSNKVYSLDLGSSEFTVYGVEDCAIYRIDVAPADETGQVLSPGKVIPIKAFFIFYIMKARKKIFFCLEVDTEESVLSTLCLKDHMEKDGGIWFSEDSQRLPTGFFNANSMFSAKLFNIKEMVYTLPLF